MTPLLFLTLCVVACLAYIQEKDINRHDSASHRIKNEGRELYGTSRNDEVIDITYNVVAKEEDGSTPVQNVEAPMTSSGVTHQVI